MRRKISLKEARQIALDTLHKAEKERLDVAEQEAKQSLDYNDSRENIMSIKRMDIAEFREKGFLQEANRLFFHPLGLALEIVIEDDGTERLGGIWDYRDDPEGVFFDQSAIDSEKAYFVDELRQSKIENRIKAGEPTEDTPADILVNSNGIQKLR